MSTARLVRRACEHYNLLHPNKPPADPLTNTSPAFVERLCVNFLRHELSSYDTNRDAIRRLTSDPATAHEAGAIIKARTLQAIAETYPQLYPECRRQAVRTDRLDREPAARRRR